MLSLAQLKLGFTTNSSSMHSIIIIPPSRKKITDSCQLGDYSRDNFYLVSLKAKMEYLGTQIKEALTSIVSPRIAAILASQVSGQPIKEHYSIDHQSLFPIPLTFDEKDLNLEFVEDLKKFMSRNDLIIKGGEDDVEKDKNLKDLNPRIPINIDKFVENPFFGTVVAKKQKKYWTLFDRKEGTKVTFSFEDNPSPLLKGDTPDVVDMKITNYCDQKCPFCYQGSSKRGKHANENIVYSYLDELGENEILEIAFGGGEPTTHPQFTEFIKVASYNNIITNFSTRSVEWMKNQKIVEVVQEYVKGIGFSVSCREDVTRVLYYVEKYKISTDKIVFHCVMDTLPYPEMQKLVRLITMHNYRILLLGFKATGRGTCFPRYNNDDIIRYLKEDALWTGNIGIDTSFANKYKKQLDSLSIPETLYYTEEGKFSCYIDAVKERIGPSSYCPKEETKSLKRKYDRKNFFGPKYNYKPTLMDFFHEF